MSGRTGRTVNPSLWSEEVEARLTCPLALRENLGPLGRNSQHPTDTGRAAVRKEQLQPFAVQIDHPVTEPDPSKVTEHSGPRSTGLKLCARQVCNARAARDHMRQ